ncbi:MAG: glycosyltransferase [Chitinispirillaceae bacterium]|nr:glycosyltransferase [Chitinispirillaceae bacterium]
MNKNIEVSIVVSSHRKDSIEDLINSLIEQNGEDDFEVIIVTDYPCDDMKIKYKEVRWLFISDKSISKKRNEGVKISEGKFLAFIDDDCIATKEWVEKGKKFLIKNPDVAAVVGSTRIEETKIYGPQLKDYKRLENKAFRTNNLFIRKEVFRKIGGFDERFTNQREDMDLFFNLVTKGYKIDFYDEIKVTHKFRHWEKWDLLKNCWNRRFDTMLFLKYPLEYIKYIKTPFSPTQLILLLAYAIPLFFGLEKNKIIALLLIIFITTLWRMQFKFISFGKYIREFLQVAIAPIVVMLALGYGLFLYVRSFVSSPT